MKKFDLNEYLKNPSRKVVTEGGRSVRIICIDAICKYPIIALVLDNDYENIELYTPNGECSDVSEEHMDLFFAPEKREGFINVYYHNKKYITEEIIYNTEEDAKRFRIHNMCYITTIRITWEE